MSTAELSVTARDATVPDQRTSGPVSTPAPDGLAAFRAQLSRWRDEELAALGAADPAAAQLLVERRLAEDCPWWDLDCDDADDERPC